MRTQLQQDADVAADAARRQLATDIRRFREDAGLSQQTVARTAGIHPSVLSRTDGARQGLLRERWQVSRRWPSARR